MYALCKGTKWTHLPVAGGWYDQHPDFVDKMIVIMSKEAEYEEKKQAIERQKAQKPQGRSYRRGR